MTDFQIGDVVKVTMPRGRNARGVEGIHMMYTTHPEAKCDGAVGTIVDINPEGTHGVPAYLVDFTLNENKWMPPYLRYWFRPDWIVKQPHPEADESGTSGVTRRDITVNPPITG
jgi:hypothetical protein